MVPVGSPHPIPCSRPELARLLVEYDALAPRDLAELRAHASGCPSCGPELALLERAERWMASRGPRPEGDECPAADELYDYAKAPGAAPLAPERAERIEAHLRRCAECGGLLATLESRPPAPLILDPQPDGYAGPLAVLARSRPDHPVPARRPTLVRRLAPLAAAAGLLLALFLWRGGDLPGSRAAGTSGVRYPTAPLLRGDQGGALLFPRGALLADGDGELVHGLLFELAPPERATALRVRVLARGSDPFSEGAEVLRLAGASAALEAPPLPPGAYTWEAWAEIDGLEAPLGRRDFEVRSDAATRAELEALASADEPERSSAALQLLTERGYAADARAWARALPARPERDAFLARTPAR